MLNKDECAEYLRQYPSIVKYERVTVDDRTKVHYKAALDVLYTEILAVYVAYGKDNVGLAVERGNRLLIQMSLLLSLWADE